MTTNTDGTEFNQGVQIYIKQLQEFPLETLQNSKWDRVWGYLDDEILTAEEFAAVRAARRDAKRAWLTAESMRALMGEDESNKSKGILTAAAITEQAMKVLSDELTKSQVYAQRQDARMDALSLPTTLATGGYMR